MENIESRTYIRKKENKDKSSLEERDEKLYVMAYGGKVVYQR